MKFRGGGRYRQTTKTMVYPTYLLTASYRFGREQVVDADAVDAVGLGQQAALGSLCTTVR